VLYASGGWEGVCVIGATTGVAALALWAAVELRSRPQRRATQLAQDAQ
jgi:hypothetical protein